MYAEYPMIRFLEANGYDVSYTTGMDVATSTGGSLLTNHKVFMSSGHDEYWSGSQRANVEAARDPGSTWRSSAATRCSGRPGPSRASTGAAPNRTLVCVQGDPLQRAGRPAGPVDLDRAPGRTRGSAHRRDGGRPQNALTGQLFVVNTGTTDIKVPAQYSKLRFWRDTSVASLTAGSGDAGAGRRDAGLRVGHGSRQRVPPRRAVRPVVDHLHVGGGLHRLRQHGQGRTAPPPTTCRCTAPPAGRWCSARARCSGRGDSTARAGHPDREHAAGHGEPVRRHGGPAVRTDLRADSLPPRRPTRPRRPRRSRPRRRGATIGDGAQDHHQRHRGGRGGGVVAGVEVSTDGGATWHPASGHDELDLQLGRARQPERDHQVPGGRRQRQHRDAVRGDSVNVGCTCSIWGTGGDAGHQRLRRAPRRSRSGSSSSSDISGLRQRYPVLQGQHQHRHPHRQPVDRLRDASWRRRPSPARPPPAGSRSPSRPRWRSTRTRRTWPPTSPRWAHRAGRGVHVPEPLTGPGPVQPRRQSSAARAAQHERHGERAVPDSSTSTFPTGSLNARELLGRRDVHPEHRTGDRARSSRRA